MRRGYIAAAVVVVAVVAWWVYRKGRGLSLLPGGAAPRASGAFSSRSYEAAGAGLPPRTLPRDVATYDTTAIPLQPGARAALLSAARGVYTGGCQKVTGLLGVVPPGLSGSACGANTAIAEKVVGAHVAVVKTAGGLASKLKFW
jgi:hypothetical protein